MAETVAARRVKLLRAQALVQELIELNERAAATETQLVAAGVSSAEVVNTINKILDAGGPIQDAGGDPGEMTDDTISGRLVNILNTAITGGVDWAGAATG
jgi:hypothetical protein